MSAGRWPAQLPPLAALLLLLAGCAGGPERPPTADSWQVHSARLAQLDDWRAEGKLALRTATLSESVSLLWRQQGIAARVQLQGPLGVNATTLSSDGRQLEIRRGDEHRVLDLSEPGALQSQTGWDLPLVALPYWLKGMPAPGLEVEALELNPEGTLLQALRQDTWEVRYEQYDVFGGLYLPTRLRILRRDTSARVILREWQITPG